MDCNLSDSYQLSHSVPWCVLEWTDLVVAGCHVTVLIPCVWEVWLIVSACRQSVVSVFCSLILAPRFPFPVTQHILFRNKHNMTKTFSIAQIMSHFNILNNSLFTITNDSKKLSWLPYVDDSIISAWTQVTCNPFKFSKLSFILCVLCNSLPSSVN